ncbi:hypothetical protein Y1Q_0008134 [Alligator mississippiensis]|uniref:Uncharacterized protein n=1 Tax=Alligator mississippiensis TaxID=8496 RepID=A0A151N6C7_ALLMI|nr:hypothetical protein Y1Q_0008134 [Alligator mississippiensis]
MLAAACGVIPGAHTSGHPGTQTLQIIAQEQEKETAKTAGNLPNIPGAVRSLPIKPKAAHAVRCYSRACGYRFSLCFQVLRRQQAASSPGKPTP